MAKILQDIWIIDFSGIVSYHRAYGNEIDVQLFGGLMSALSKLAEEISNGRLTRFDLENKCYGIIKKENLLFIANSNEDIDSKTINYELKLIAYKFLNLYRDILNYNHNNNKVCDLRVFFDFTEKIKNSLMYAKKKNGIPFEGLGKNLPEVSEWLKKIQSLSNQNLIPIFKKNP